MRLFSRRGKDRVKGEEEVEEKVQNMKTAVMATANADQLNEVDIAVLNWCDWRVWRNYLEILWTFQVSWLGLSVFRVGSRIDLRWGHRLSCLVILLLGLW